MLILNLKYCEQVDALSQPLQASLTNSNARITVDCLNQLLALMTNNPVRVNLRCALGIQRNHLEFTEVCLTDVNIFRTHIIDVGHFVLIKIILADITTTIA